VGSKKRESFHHRGTGEDIVKAKAIIMGVLSVDDDLVPLRRELRRARAKYAGQGKRKDRKNRG